MTIDSVKNAASNFDVNVIWQKMKSLRRIT